MARIYWSNRDFLNKKAETEKQKLIEENRLAKEEYEKTLKAEEIRIKGLIRAEKEVAAVKCVISVLGIILLNILTIPIIGTILTILLIIYACHSIVCVLYEEKPKVQVTPPKFKHGMTAAEKGNEGEEYVLKYLSELPNDYVVFDDIVIGYYQGNIDHVVVGPTGIFVIETKNWTYQKIQRKYGRWYLQTERSFEVRIPYKDPVEQVTVNAVQLRKELEQNLSISEWVEAVVVFTRLTMEVQAPQRSNVSIVKPYELNDLIRSNNKTLSQETVQKISKHLIQNYINQTTHDLKITK